MNINNLRATAFIVIASFVMMGNSCDGDNGNDGADGAPGADGQDGGGGIQPESLEPPAGPPAAFNINTSGGGGMDGGSGGNIFLVEDSGTLGGNIKMFNTGEADAGFTFPATVVTNLGAVPLVVTAAELTIAVEDTTEPAHGTPYLMTDSSSIFISDFNDNPDLGGDTPVATGVSVSDVTTLTFALNSNMATEANIYLANDFYNDGTVTVEHVDVNGNLDSGDLTINLDTFHGDTGSEIVLTGDDVPAQSPPETDGPGGHGGNFNLRAGDDDWYGGPGYGLTNRAGAFFNQGTIDTSGGNGWSGSSDDGYGGDAGHIIILASQQSINTGNMSANGGNGFDNFQNGSGGGGGSIQIKAVRGNNFNSGDLEGSGGDADGDVGNGGSLSLKYFGFDKGILLAVKNFDKGILLAVKNTGDILNSGDLTANGGDGPGEWEPPCECPSGDLTASECVCLSGGGGHGGDIRFVTTGGKVVSSGDLTSTGGDLLGDGDESGGSGGDFEARAEPDGGAPEAGWYADGTPFGNFEFSGNIDLSGGSGGTIGDGGYGGDIDVYMDARGIPNNQEIIFFGYLSINTSGAAGLDNGGSAGGIVMRHDSSSPSRDVNGPSGGVVNYVPVNATGGDGPLGDGGDGGFFALFTEDKKGYTTPGELAYNFANLDLYGGDGDGDVVLMAGVSNENGYHHGGGHGGAVFIWGYNGAENTGNINARGGNSSGDNADGGDGAYVYHCYDCRELRDWPVMPGVSILSDLGPAVNSGNIDAYGGNATGLDTGMTPYGGDGMLIEIVGHSVDNSGNLSTAGGDATVGFGGDGDVVFLYGVFDGATNTASTIDVCGGFGDVPKADGDDGEVWIDGMNVTEVCPPAPAPAP